MLRPRGYARPPMPRRSAGIATSDRLRKRVLLSLGGRPHPNMATSPPVHSPALEMKRPRRSPHAEKNGVNPSPRCFPYAANVAEEGPWTYTMSRIQRLPPSPS
jgi:hypothetical protein